MHHLIHTEGFHKFILIGPRMGNKEIHRRASLPSVCRTDVSLPGLHPGAGVRLAVAPSDCCRGDSELVNEGRTRGSDTVGVCGSQSGGGLLLFRAIVAMLPRLCV